MNKIIAIPALLFGLLLSANAQAAVVNVYDGDLNDYDPADTYVFLAEFSAADPMVTVGFNMPQGVLWYLTVTAPPQFSLTAEVWTGPNFTGTTVMVPNGFSQVAAGTSFDFPFSGDGAFAGDSLWLTASIEGDQAALDYIATLPDGSLSLNAVPAAVPVPAAVWLFGSGLIGLVGMARRKQA